MSNIRSKGMAPEMVVRRLLHAMGFRYRLHAASLPGKPDIVFRARRRVIFVHGCFWHLHRAASCKIARLPKSRGDYWVPKLNRNAERDKRSIAALKKAGWKVLVVWECQLKNSGAVARRLSRFLAV